MKLNWRELAYGVFGRHFREKGGKYGWLQRDLTQARIGISADHWLSTTMFASLLVPLFSVLCAYLFALLVEMPAGSLIVLVTTEVLLSVAVLFLYGRPRTGKIAPGGDKAGSRVLLFTRLVLAFSIFVNIFLLVSLFVPSLRVIICEPLVFAGGFLETMANYVAPHLVYAAIPIGLFIGTMAVFLVYPRTRAWERKRKIDGLCPSAISLMGAVAGVGLTPYNSMKFLAQEKAYGEVSEEMNYLVRDVELFGRDLITALRQLSLDTPSKRLKIFLQGAVATVVSGGNLRKYLTAKSEEYSRVNRRKLDEYVETLGLVAEIFVIVGVVMPTLLTLMFTIMSIMGQVPLVMMYGVILMVPVVTVMMVIMASASEPTFLR